MGKNVQKWRLALQIMGQHYSIFYMKTKAPRVVKTISKRTVVVPVFRTLSLFEEISRTNITEY